MTEGARNPDDPPAPRRPKTVREREDARREAKLTEVQRQVDSGSLSIRRMTDEERDRYGEPKPNPRRRRD